VWASGSAANATCPAVPIAHAGSLVICQIHLDAGTATSSVRQSPTPATGWTFDRTSGAEYQEIFAFHTTAPAAGVTLPAMAVPLTAGGVGWVAETVAFAPASASATPQPWPASAVETPTQADAFVNSAGLNIHLGESGTLYSTNVAAIVSLLQNSGIKHVRDAMHPGEQSMCTQHRAIGAAGLGIDEIATYGVTMAQIEAWNSCVGPAIDAIEGANELDLSNLTTWASLDDAFQRSLDAAMTSTRPGTTVIGPSVTTESAFTALGDLSGVENDGNVHAYFAGYNPGTSGWGATDSFGTYGSLAWNLAIAHQASKSKPIVMTETGYGDTGGGTGNNGVPAATKGRYTLRTLLANWRAGVPRTYLYELIDEGSAPFSNYGIATATGAPKPVYTALKALLGYLADPGAAFTPAPLSYAIGAASSVQHVLLQRRNGHDELAIWAERSEWNPATGTAIATTPEPVTLTFEHAPSALVSTVFEGSGTTAKGALSVNGTTATLTVDGDVTVIDITP
jgi:hypothetical protein